MSATNVEELHAGHDLDIMIAEKVLGWQRIEGAEIAKLEHVEINPNLWHQQRVWINPTTKERMACEECGSIPPFSTDISAAWEVVEKLRSLKWSIELYTSPTFDFMCTLRSVADFTKPLQIHRLKAPTGPLAICRAAMEAVFKKIPPRP